jgi:enamine deaminase RidA (YjgF/YER057c/UK114 family)
VERLTLTPSAGAGAPAAQASLVTSLERGVEVRRLFHVISSPRGATFVAQASAALDEVADALRLAGMEPRHLLRTWYFLNDIKRNYAALNAARDAFFDRWNVTEYPASTGIGAVLPKGTQLAVMFEAVRRGDENPAASYDSGYQCAPVTYGPRFVRANTLAVNGCRIVNISGISSIDQAGASICSRDEARIVDYVMRSFAELLRSADMAFEDICSSYVYMKSEPVRRAFEQHLSRCELDFPRLSNMVDICRPDLVFEIEARAIKPEAGSPAAASN